MAFFMWLVDGLFTALSINMLELIKIGGGILMKEEEERKKSEECGLIVCNSVV